MTSTSINLFLYFLSLVFGVYIFRLRKVTLFSNYAIFLFFSILYTIAPVLNHLFNTFLSSWAVIYSGGIIEKYLLLSSLCNFCFFGVYAFVKIPGNPVGLQLFPSGSAPAVIFPILLVLGTAVIFLGIKYPYGQPRPEMIHSVISNLTVLLSGVFVLYLFVGRGWKVAAGFGLLLACMLVERSRWAFVSALIALFFYFDDQGRVTARVKVFSLLFLPVLLSAVALYRVGQFSFETLWAPFLVEGVMGSYPAVQSVELVSKGFNSFSYFLDYVVDPLVYMVPRVLFYILDVQKDAVGIFPAMIAKGQPLLTMPFAPRGGFHYIAQAHLSIPYVGPLLITSMLALLTGLVENRRGKSIPFLMFYYLFSAGFFFVFIKTIFALTVKYFLTFSLPTGVFLLFSWWHSSDRGITGEVSKVLWPKAREKSKSMEPN